MDENDRKWGFSRKVTLGNLLVVIAFVVSAVVSWDNMNARVAKLEDTSKANTQVLSRIDRTLGLLQQRLADYRLHKHEGSRIIYPNSDGPPR